MSGRRKPPPPGFNFKPQQEQVTVYVSKVSSCLDYEDFTHIFALSLFYDILANPK